MCFERFRSLPNKITAARLLMLPFLWLLFGANQLHWVGIGLAAAAVTDFLDGFAAARLNQASAFGSKLDSFADFLVFLSALIWAVMFLGDFLESQAGWVITALIVNAASLLLGWIKFRQIGNLHLYSSKAAAAAVYLFLVHAFLSGPHPGLFNLALGLYLLSSIEALVLQLQRSEVDEHIGSVLKYRSSRERGLLGEGGPVLESRGPAGRKRTQAGR